ncbi:MAG: polysaccharide lyase beta-sandwich domain-containing protein [Sphingobacterium sp.]|jgi:chondroitin AC lyase|nr:polysaccharide lyase beta-sandwich domain-containing protein [Sphingobacterium sp.]
MMLIFLFAFLGDKLTYGNSQDTADFSKIRSRIVEDEYNSSSNNLDSEIFEKLAFMRSDGSFSFIDYSSRNMTKWPPSEHLAYLQRFALAYVREESHYYSSKVLHRLICNGLDYWLQKVPICDNWWYNTIDAGQKMGMILLLMDKGKKSLPKRLLRESLTYMIDHCGSPKDYLGANKLDIALHWLYRGLVQKDEAVVAMACSELFEPTKLTVYDDGIQHDLSYGAHRHQIYLGGYGEVYVNGTVKVADYLRETRFAIHPEKLKLLDQFVRSSYLPVIRGQYRLYNVMGRSFTRIENDSIFRTGTLQTLSRFKRLVPQHAPEYENAIKRITGTKGADFKVIEGHRYYWRTDYTFCQRKGYSIDLRTTSLRTARSESLNGENLKGYFLAEGGMSINVDGAEYTDVSVVWDWSKIPGTTVAAYPLEQIPDHPWPAYGQTLFSGGVSNGRYGVTGFGFKNNFGDAYSKAKKGWFFLDDLVVCLGNGISSRNEFPIATTLNQTRRKGNVSVLHSTGKLQTLYDHHSGRFSFEKLKWIHHDKIGYFFLDSDKIELSIENKIGNWKAINTSNMDKVVAKDIFCLWKDHGIKPREGTYAYVIVPNLTLDEMQRTDEILSNFEVIKNLDSLQVVHDKRNDIWQIIAYQAASFKLGAVTVCLDAPCTLMLEGLLSKHIKGFISDPTQIADSITIQLLFPDNVFYSKEILIDNYFKNRAKSGMTYEFEF